MKRTLGPLIGLILLARPLTLMAQVPQMLSHPSLPSLPSFSQLLPSFAWQEQPKSAEQDGPRERSFRWGNGLGVDGYTHPGTRLLWGY